MNFEGPENVGASGREGHRCRRQLGCPARDPIAEIQRFPRRIARRALGKRVAPRLQTTRTAIDRTEATITEVRVLGTRYR